MATVTANSGVGPLLREWRARRRLTQLDLALDAGISTRHLSFIETGRSRPSADMVLLLAERLELPFRERNDLLLAAGHAPAFPERSFDDPELAPLREALDLILSRHEPYPALVVDRRWNIVAANSATLALAEWIDPALLAPPVNMLRVVEVLVPKIANLSEVRAYFVERIPRQVALTADESVAALLEAMESRAAPEADVGRTSEAAARGILLPVRLRGGTAPSCPSSARWPRSARRLRSRPRSCRSSPSSRLTKRPPRRSETCVYVTGDVTTKVPGKEVL